jgi:hypothetical protein
VGVLAFDVLLECLIAVFPFVVCFSLSSSIACIAMNRTFFCALSDPSQRIQTQHHKHRNSSLEQDRPIAHLFSQGIAAICRNADIYYSPFRFLSPNRFRISRTP